MESKQKKQMDLLTAIEQIVEKAKDSKLSPEFYRKASRYIKYVSDKLDLTKEQSVMLALFVNRSDDSSIRISELSVDVKCSTIHILRYMNDIDVLEKREFVRCCRDINSYRKSISYRVPLDVIEAMKRDEKYVPRKCTGLTCQELFGELEDVFDLRKDNEITYEALTQKINNLFEDNKQLQFVKLVNGFFLADEDDDDKMLAVLFCHLCVNNGDDEIGFHDLDFLFDDKREWNRQKISIIASQLFKASDRIGCRRAIAVTNMQIILKDGMAVKSLADPLPFEGGDAVSLAEYYSNRGADELLIFDQSDSDGEHDQSLTLMRRMARKTDIPMWGLGNIKRVEDVKKILYAGCRKAVLNGSKESNLEMLEEVSKRFGRDKIAVCLDLRKDAVLSAGQTENIRNYACALVLLTDLSFCRKHRIGAAADEAAHCGGSQTMAEKEAGASHAPQQICPDLPDLPPALQDCATGPSGLRRQASWRKRESAQMPGSK